MAADYDLIASRSSRQVLSPTTVVDSQVCTIQTKPSGVIAEFWVNADTFATDGAVTQLTAFAQGIESIIAQGKAIGGIGSSYLDANGLQAVNVTFTVAYKPDNALAGAITTDVDVPVGLLAETDPTISRVLMAQAVALVDAAYASLVRAAGDTTGTAGHPAPTPLPPIHSPLGQAPTQPVAATPTAGQTTSA